MKFDAYAVLGKLRLEGESRAIRATCAIQPAPDSTNSTNSTDRPAVSARSEAVPCSTNSTNSTGVGIERLPQCIAAAVAEAFADYWATDDPRDPRAWV